jgi:hypothetical protein
MASMYRIGSGKESPPATSVGFRNVARLSLSVLRLLDLMVIMDTLTTVNGDKPR